MSSTQRAVATSAYALFALQQPLSLDRITEGVPALEFPEAATTMPEWFGAAASDESSLLEMAPELVAVQEDAEAVGVADVSGIDLIHVYAPELAAASRAPEPAPEPEPEPEPKPAAETPRTSTQIGLLKELSNLDN